MRQLNHWNIILIIAVLLLLLSSVVLSASHLAGAFPASAHVSPPAASSAKPTAGPSLEPPLSIPFRHLARDSEFAVYHNPDYGISFRYPRNYALIEGTDTDDLTLLRYQEEFAAEQPGAVAVATVVIPEDAYPNTSFRSGALELVVHPGVSSEVCRASLAPLRGGPGVKGTLSIHGIPFDWRLGREDAGGTDVESAAYAGFSRGTCYEFVLEIVASNPVELDSLVKPADLSKILRPLEKIVLSFQLHPATAEKR